MALKKACCFVGVGAGVGVVGLIFQSQWSLESSHQCLEYYRQKCVSALQYLLLLDHIKKFLHLVLHGGDEEIQLFGQLAVES